MPKTKEEPVTSEEVGDDGLIELDVIEPEEKKPKPEPKVGDAAYDWSAHYDTKDLYTHTFPDGKVVAIRKFQTILSDTFLYKIRKLPTDLDFRISCIDEASCETAQAVMESLATEPGADPLKDMFTAWTAAGTSRGDGDEGLTPGK